MRITNYTMRKNSASNINLNKVAEDKLNTQLSTGKKISRPSDDPVVAIRALRLRTNLSEIDQYYSKNVPDAKSWLSVTEKAIKSATDTMTSVYENFVSGAEGFKTADDRAKVLENLKGLKDEIYASGNADYAGRYVFTGYRTGDALTFSEDTTADYRGINDTFNASDVKRATYVEGVVDADDVKSLSIGTNDVTTVKEDRVNRIRLSYDNINGSVLSGPTEGWDGDEVGTITGWNNTDDYDDYFNEDGTLTVEGRGWSGMITVHGEPVGLTFNEPYDQTMSFGPEYVRSAISDATVSGTTEEIKVKLGDTTYTIQKDIISGAYSVDKGASLKDDGSGNMTLTIPGPNGTKDIYSEVTVNASGPSLTSAFEFARISDINYWITKPEYDKETIVPTPNVSGTTDEIKVEVGGTTYTVTKNSWGKYECSDTGVLSVNKDDKGNLTLKIGTTASHKEIKIDVSKPSLISANNCTQTSTGTEYAGGVGNGGVDIGGNAFGSIASSVTTLIYRTALTEPASIPSSSVTTDPVYGLQKFEINQGSNTYKIQKFQSEDRWFAVDDSGQAISSIKVEQNTDGSFKIAVDTTDPSDPDPKTANVFNVSADGSTINSYYSETYLDVKITDSTSTVFADTTGKEFTAYQYLALNEDDKNVDADDTDERDPAKEVFLLADTGELVFGSDIAETLSGLKDIPGVDTISVIYDKSNYEKGDLKPEHYFDSKSYDEDHKPLNPRTYDDQDQKIKYAIGFNQDVVINTNASEVYDPQIAREIDDLIRIIEQAIEAEEKYNNINLKKKNSDSYTQAQKDTIDKLYDAVEKEYTYITDIMQKMFEKGMTSAQNYLNNANTALTAVGNRGARVDLIENRLSSQSTNFKKLSAENEDADITETAVRLNSAEMSYQGALAATGRIAQTTLLNYL